jgi:hypothetical protein
MPASGALLGYGATFTIATSGSSPTDQISLGEIRNINPPSAKVDLVEVTHMQSPNRRREYISGLIDGGEASFEMNFIPGSVGDLELIEILTLAVGLSRRRSCRIRYPNGITDTFEGELQEYTPTVPTDDKMTANVSFKVTGDVVRGFST